MSRVAARKKERNTQTLFARFPGLYILTTFLPQGLLRVRATLKPLGVSIETVNAAMETVTVRKDKTRVVLKLSKPHDKATKGQLTISGIPAGTYRVSTATTSAKISCDGKLRCEAPLPVEATVTLVGH